MTVPPKRWDPKPWLEHHPWSLLRAVGLPKRTARTLLASWLVASLVAFVLHAPRDWAYLGVGFFGFLMLRYVLQRLQGVPAEFTGPSEAITEDWPFQFRLAADLVACLFLLWAAAALSFGLPAVRSMLWFWH